MASRRVSRWPPLSASTRHAKISAYASVRRPAANLPLESFKDVITNDSRAGVYCGWAQLQDHGIFKMVMSVGCTLVSSAYALPGSNVAITRAAFHNLSRTAGNPYYKNTERSAARPVVPLFRGYRRRATRYTTVRRVIAAGSAPAALIRRGFLRQVASHRRRRVPTARVRFRFAW